jgi:hypothetical protein
MPGALRLIIGATGAAAALDEALSAKPAIAATSPIQSERWQLARCEPLAMSAFTPLLEEKQTSERELCLPFMSRRPRYCDGVQMNALDFYESPDRVVGLLSAPLFAP